MQDWNTSVHQRNFVYCYTYSFHIGCLYASGELEETYFTIPVWVRQQLLTGNTISPKVNANEERDYLWTHLYFSDTQVISSLCAIIHSKLITIQQQLAV